MTSPPSSDRTIHAAIFLATLALLLLCPVEQSSDSRYSLLLSDSLLHSHTFQLDGYAIPRLPPVSHGYKTTNGDMWQIEVFEDHLYYAYAPGTSVLSIPFLAAANALGVSVVNARREYDVRIAATLERVIASGLMALFAPLCYATARYHLDRVWSALLTVAGVFGSPILSSASRALWSHTWLVLLLQVALLRIVAHAEGRVRIRPALLGTLLSWMYFVRPTGSVSILAVLGYVAIQARDELLRTLSVLAAWLSGFALYSWTHFRALLPGYYHVPVSFDHPVDSLLGTLCSPSRGLFVYVPWTAALIYLTARRRMDVLSSRLGKPAIAATGLHFLLLAGFSVWWGGGCYGARYSTDVIPWLVLLCALAMRAHFAAPGCLRRAPIAAFLLLALCAIAINARGALSHATWDWNALPDPIDAAPDALWDWRSPQFLAGLVPMQPRVFRPLPQSLDFRSPESSGFVLSGFGPADDDGRWTGADDAVFYFGLPRAGTDLDLSMTIAANLAPRVVKRQRVFVTVNGVNAGTLELTSRKPVSYSIALPARALGTRNVVRFRFPDSFSPMSLGLGNDPRTLAAQFRRLEILHA
ncbi:MAG: hypothetical protein U0166_03920 [Acidobacteriota bacterium]